MNADRGEALTCGSLFSGAGLLDYGLTCAGFEHRWFCESDPYCRQILELRWPGVPVYDDVRAVDSDATPVDLIAGGFPCHTTSQAAARAERAEGWLWPEMARVVDALRPRWVLIENPEALRYANRGLAEVLGDLADLGFDAEWRVVRASEVGAPHRRARVWVVAYPNGDREPALLVDDETSILQEPPAAVPWPDPPLTADLRLADGAPGRLDGLRVLGNGVVPCIGEWIGRRILEEEGIDA